MTRHFDYVDYLLTALLNQMAVHVSLTKTQASSTINLCRYKWRQCISGKIYYFKGIKGGRDENVTTMQY